MTNIITLSDLDNYIDSRINNTLSNYRGGAEGLDNTINNYIDDKISNQVTSLINSIWKGTLIPANSNLNDYLQVGSYYHPANSTTTTISNRPNDYAFRLLVFRFGEANFIHQVAFNYNGRNIAIRYYGDWDNTWSSWKLFS